MHNSWIYEAHFVKDVVDVQIPEENFHVGKTLFGKGDTHQSFVGLKFLKDLKTGTYTHMVRGNIRHKR